MKPSGSDISHVPDRRKDLVCQDLGTEVVLYDPQAGAIHVLNRTAHLIWDLCDGDHSLGDIREELMAAFSAAPERDVLADVQQTVDTFAQQDLLARR